MDGAANAIWTLRIDDSARPVASRWGIADWIASVALILACFGVFANGLDGSFVYDDEHQIVNNPLITRPGMEWRALTSDVWAFKTAEAETDGSVPPTAVSNYWRPAFVGLLIIEHRLFGLESTRPWHVVNVLMHAAVCVLSFALLRRLGVSSGAAFCGGLIFAVHPVHVESITWISGSPDPLLSIGLLTAMLGATRVGTAKGTAGLLSSWAMVLVGYLLAVTSKEVGMLAWAPVTACVWAARRESSSGRVIVNAGLVAGLGLLIAIAFWVARSRVLGQSVKEAPNAAEWPSVFLTAPAIMFFYLRELVWPWQGLGGLHATGSAAEAGLVFPGGVAPAHPVRAVTTATLNLKNFWLPLATCAVVGVSMLVASWRNRAALVGMVLFGAMLAPAFNIRVFPFEHLVRDRYLYLPLLGVLMMLIGPLDEWIRSRLSLTAVSTGQPERGRHMRLAVLALSVSTIAASVALAAKTVRYNPVWTDNLRLWRAGADADPSSSLAATQVGYFHSRANELDEAIAAYDRAYTLAPMYMVRSGRANVRMKLGDREALAGRTQEAQRHYSLAETDARSVLDALKAEKGPPDYVLSNAYESLGTALFRLGRHNDAAELFREAMGQVPFSRALFAGKLAVVLYTSGDKAGALSVLEQSREISKSELNAESKLVLHRLGMLYGEMERGQDAVDALTEFLVHSEEWKSHVEVNDMRQQVIKIFKASNLPLPK